MGRASTVAKLDPAVQAEVASLIRAGRSIDEIVAALRELGAQASRSAVGRYVKSARDSMEKYRQAQEVAKVWVDKLEAEPQGDVARLLPEMLRTVAFQTLSTMGEGEDAAGPQELMFLARALKDLSGATKANVEVALLLKRMREQAAAAATDVAKTAKKAGLSEATIDMIRARILGIPDAAKPA